MANLARPYDIVLIGATGFTGGLTAEYLLAQQAKGPVKLALAGRDEAKLTAVRERLAKAFPGVELPDLLIADSHDPASLDVLCAQTRVVISTVGPYQLHGEPLVAACVRQGCDYVDLTGEPEFVDLLRERYGAAAEQARVRIVNSCGFDSIPHDLGVFYTVQTLKQQLGERLAEAEVQIDGLVRAKGDFSGGTWQSAINAFGRAREHLAKRRQQRQGRQPGARDVRSVMRFQRVDHGWAVPLPTIDPEVVIRSARRYPSYGRKFRYGHYAVVGSLPMVVAGVAGVGSLVALAQFKPTREWLLRYRGSGEGPSAQRRADNWFRVEFVASAMVPGQSAVEVRCEVSGGDPGYGDTAKMLAESALTLAVDHDRLPPNVGVLTPAEAMGEALLERLQAAGMGFRVVAGAAATDRAA